MEILYTLDLHNIDSESNADIKNTIFKIPFEINPP